MPIDAEGGREPSKLSMPPKLSCRPPVLASVILRKDMIPSEPGRRIFKRIVVGAGTVSGIASFALGGASIPSVLVSLTCFALAVLGVVNMTYRTRALVVGGIATSGMIATTVAAITWNVPWALVGVTGAICWLSASLLFRAFHRGSKRSRLFVGIGIAACTIWLMIGGVHTRFLSFTTEWQVMFPTLLAGGLAMLTILSLLAYMGSGSTGGSQIWGLFLVLWFAAYSIFTVALRVWPIAGQGTATWIGKEVATIGVGTPFFLTVSAMAIAQLLATARAHELEGSGAVS